MWQESHCHYQSGWKCDQLMSPWREVKITCTHIKHTHTWIQQACWNCNSFNPFTWNTMLWYCKCLLLIGLIFTLLFLHVIISGIAWLLYKGWTRLFYEGVYINKEKCVFPTWSLRSYRFHHTEASFCVFLVCSITAVTNKTCVPLFT